MRKRLQRGTKNLSPVRFLIPVIVLAQLIYVGPSVSAESQKVVEDSTLSSGLQHTCALTEDDDVLCWGSNTNGETNVPLIFGVPIQVSAGGSHTCLLAYAPIAVHCWGSNTNGEINVPLIFGVPIQLSAGGSHTCFLTEDGAVRCWGLNTSGETNVPSDLGAVRHVSAGGSHTCALTVDGVVRCWGLNTSGETNVPSDLGVVAQVSAGGSHTCVLTLAGSGAWSNTNAAGVVRCWGSISDEQTTVPFIPTNLGLVQQVSAGGSHTCVSTEAGVVRCWGSNSKGQTTVSHENNDSGDSSPWFAQPTTQFIGIYRGRIDGELTLGSALSAQFDTNLDAIQFQWFRDGAAIAGATESTYTITSQDLGANLTVNGVSTDGRYVSYYLTFKHYVNFPFVSSAVPSVDGVKSIGNRLSVGLAGWEEGASFSCQWLRDGQVIAGETDCAYSVKLTDLGANLSVRVTGSKDRHRSMVRTSLAFTVDTLFSPIASSRCGGSLDQSAWAGNQTQPRIQGLAKFESTLTGSVGKWPVNTKFCTLWLRDESEIITTKNKDYIVQAKDIGHNLRFIVVGTNSQGQSEFRYSAPVVATLGSFVHASSPTILGQPKYRAKVTGSFKPWGQGVKYSFQWLSDGKVISRASSKTLTLPLSKIGSRLSFRVCGEKAHFEFKCKTSRESTVIDTRKVQNQLIISASSTSSDAGKPVGLSSTGGSGDGLVTFRTDNPNCTVNGSNVSSSSSTTCVIYAVKDGDKNYKPKRSNSLEIDFEYRPRYEIRELSGRNNVSCPVGYKVINYGIGNIPETQWWDPFGNARPYVTVYKVERQSRWGNSFSASVKWTTYQSQSNGSYLAPNGLRYFVFTSGWYGVPVWITCGGYW